MTILIIDSYLKIPLLALEVLGQVCCTALVELVGLQKTHGFEPGIQQCGHRVLAGCLVATQLFPHKAH